MVALTKEMAHKQAAEIFSAKSTTDKGASVMSCTRCDHLPDKDRGAYHRVANPSGLTKAKEHLAVYCKGLRPEMNSEDQYSTRTRNICAIMRCL